MKEPLIIEWKKPLAEILDSDQNLPAAGWRVFSGLERSRFTLAAQEYLWKLYHNSLVPWAELECVIMELMSLDIIEVGIGELEWAIEEFMTDSVRATLLSGAFPRYYCH